MLRELLLDPSVRNVPVDAAGLIAQHQRILQNKPLLRSAYEHFYREMGQAVGRHAAAVGGLEIEYGSGCGFLKTLRPQVLATDVRPVPGLDMQVDATRTPFSNASVRGLYAINVFHHVPSAYRFLDETARILADRGCCVLIEPHAGWLSAALHRRIHDDEFFDPNQPGWTNTMVTGPMSGANQALAHNVFTRDRALFEREYGRRLRIVEQRYVTNGLRFLLSGGLNFRCLVPGALAGAVQAVEQLAQPLARWWSLHQMTVLQRIPR